METSRREKTQSVSLTKIEGVVSVRSFDMLVREILNTYISSNLLRVLHTRTHHPTTPANRNGHTYTMTNEHIFAASSLPNGHAVRGILASAVVEGYIRCN